MKDGTTKSGWELVADEDGAAAVIAGLLTVDPDEVYTRSELAEAANLPLKTLYLIEILDDLEAAGMIDRIDDPTADTEASFAIDEASEIYQAARQFDEALSARH